VQQQMRQNASRCLERAEELKRRISPIKSGGATSSSPPLPAAAPSRAPWSLGGKSTAASRGPAPLPPRPGYPVTGDSRGSGRGEAGGGRGGAASSRDYTGNARAYAGGARGATGRVSGTSPPPPLDPGLEASIITEKPNVRWDDVAGLEVRLHRYPFSSHGPAPPPPYFEPLFHLFRHCSPLL
jgi:hypothetical protein